MSDIEADYPEVTSQDDIDMDIVDIITTDDKEEEEEEEENNLEIEDDPIEIKGKNTHRKTWPFITRYEKGRIIGTRALQLNQGAYPLIETHETDPIKIAQAEFKENKIPLIIRRYLPDGSYEDWNVSDLKDIGV